MIILLVKTNNLFLKLILLVLRTHQKNLSRAVIMNNMNVMFLKPSYLFFEEIFLKL
jgi:hypothetical protein